MKTNNTSIPKKKVSKRKTPDNNDVSATFAWRTIPISIAAVNKMVDDLPLYAANPAHKFISGFYRAHGLSKACYHTLLEKHAHLRSAHEEAMRELGERMVGNAIDFKANWAPVAKIMHMYSQEFKAVDEFHSQLKEEQNSAAGLQVIHLPPVARTNVLDEFEQKKSLTTNHKEGTHVLE